MDPAVITLLILIGCIVLFLTGWFPSAATAVLGCVLFVLTGVCSFSKAFSGFSSSTTIMVAGMLVIGDAMFQSGLASTLSRIIIRVGANSERRFLTAGILLSAVLHARGHGRHVRRRVHPDGEHAPAAGAESAGGHLRHVPAAL